MTQHVISSLTEVFEALAGGTPRADFDRALDSLRSAAEASEGSETFDRIGLAMSRIRSELQDRASAERGLNMLVETTRDMSSTLGTDDLMRLIVRRTRSLAGADLAWLTLLEKGSNEFRSAHLEGHLSPEARVLRCDVEYGLVGAILRTNSYFHTNDYLNDDRFHHLPELDQQFRKEGIVSLTGFPMLVGDEVTGFLFAAYRYRRDVTGRELSVLGSLALHAGIAIRNAGAFKAQAEALAEAETSRAALVDHIGRVEASAEAHDEMASLLATGADLPHYLQRMAGQVNGAIFLYDDDLKEREGFVSPLYSGAMAGDLRGDPRTIARLSPASQALHSGRAQMLRQTETEECRAIQLHGGTGRPEMLVICTQGRLDPIEVRNLERAAVALAIAKLWAEKREAEQMIATSTLIRHVTQVAVPDDSSLAALRTRLDIGSGQAVQLALIGFEGLDHAEQALILRDLAVRHGVLVDETGNDFLAIAGIDALRAFRDALTRRQEAWKVGGVLSPPLADLTVLAQETARLRDSLAVLRVMQPLHRFHDHAEVSLFARIFEGRNAADLSTHVTALLQPIEARGPRQALQLKQTLRSYFEHQFNARRAADELGIHINTLRQRLQTLRDLTGGWDDPLKALEFQVALRLDKILSEEALA